MTRRNGRDLFGTVRSEGAILPTDLLQRLLDLDRKLPGLTSEAYHLVPGESFGEATSRAWQRLQALWAGFKASRDRLPEADTGTTLTRQRWLLPLFQELGYGRLTQSGSVKADGAEFPIFNNWGDRVPIHLVGCNVDLDSRTAGTRGAAKISPHGLVQDLLNRSDDHLWAFVSNGVLLRVLRDSFSLTRLSYVQFDLEAMFEGGAYSDFALLWMVCHQSRVEAEKPTQCYLEQWSQLAQEEGTRALENLRAGVEAAIAELGRGFLAHPENRELREHLRAGKLTTQDYYRQLLRLVYRLIFLFVAEDRDLLHPSDSPNQARLLYQKYYSTRRLRNLASRRRGTRHGDLIKALCLVMEKLGSDFGCPELALPALGSFLWSPAALPDVSEASLSNECLLDAIRALALSTEEGALRPVDFKNLGAEELGSVYESLLELHPKVNLEAAEFKLDTAPGHERKTTGSYYTPESLIQCLLDSALDPVLDEAAKKPAPEQAILDLKVCDPACGSGHFLIGAAHRIAKRLASVRTGDDEPSPEAVRKALRDVIGRCLYGVDINPMSVELCKVALWMEALEPGKPLSFLDHHIRCGNSLLGTTSTLMVKGIPDEAFTPIDGDDKETCKRLRRQNKAEREAFARDGLWAAEAAATYEAIETQTRVLSILSDESLRAVKEKEQKLGQIEESQAYRRARLAADGWCAAFFIRKAASGARAITHDTVIQLHETPEKVPIELRDEIESISSELRFFHWHLVFPNVFSRGGFDCVLGNPPWEQMQTDPREYFANRASTVSEAQHMAARDSAIDALSQSDPILYGEFKKLARLNEALQKFIHGSQRFPLTSHGRLNTAPLFAELSRQIAARQGRIGIIVPSGIATDSFNQQFFRDLVSSHTLQSLFDFQSGPGYFGAIAHGTFKFCLLTLGQECQTIELAFFLRNVGQLVDQDRRFMLTAEDIADLNPNTGTCPIFRNQRDAELSKLIYRRIPVLVQDGAEEKNLWGFDGLLMFMMNTASGLFRTSDQLGAIGFSRQGIHMVRGEEFWLPLYEAKMVHQYNHRFGDYKTKPADSEGTALPEVPLEDLKDPTFVPEPRYWVPMHEVEARLKSKGWQHRWLLGWRDITGAEKARTVIGTVVPRVGVGNQMPLMLVADKNAERVACLSANLSAFVFDYIARQKVGGAHLNFYILKQLPILTPGVYDSPCPWSSSESIAKWIETRALELTFTSYDLAPFAAHLGYHGPPFCWDDERRAVVRCELDAAFLHLYLPVTAEGDWQLARRGWGHGREESPADLTDLRKHFPTPRHAANYILDTFQIVKRKDEVKLGTYRTKDTILKCYDAMATAIATGVPYQTCLDPPPADPRCAHDPSMRPDWVDLLYRTPVEGAGADRPISVPRRRTPSAPSPAGRASQPPIFPEAEPPSLFRQGSEMSAEVPSRPREANSYIRIKALLQERGTITSSDAQSATGLDAAGVRPLLQRLVQEGLAVVEGQRRGTRYVRK